MKLVTNGKQFAVKRGWWRIGQYLDLKDPEFWWSRTSQYFMDCWGTEEKARECMGFYKPKKVM